MYLLSTSCAGCVAVSWDEVVTGSLLNAQCLSGRSVTNGPSPWVVWLDMYRCATWNWVW